MICILSWKQFWRGTLGEANRIFSSRHPKGEITVIVEGKEKSVAETPSESELEHELRSLVSNGHSISMVFIEVHNCSSFDFVTCVLYFSVLFSSIIFHIPAKRTLLL